MNHLPPKYICDSSVVDYSFGTRYGPEFFSAFFLCGYPAPFTEKIPIFHCIAVGHVTHSRWSCK